MTKHDQYNLQYDIKQVDKLTKFITRTIDNLGYEYDIEPQEVKSVTIDGKNPFSDQREAWR